MVIAYDLVRRTRIPNAHAGCPLEEGIHCDLSIGGCWRRNARQALLNGALQCRLDIFTRQSGETLGEFVDLGGTDVHGPPDRNAKTITSLPLSGAPVTLAVEWSGGRSVSMVDGTQRKD